MGECFFETQEGRVFYDFMHSVGGRLQHPGNTEECVGVGMHVYAFVWVVCRCVHQVSPDCLQRSFQHPVQ